jgi:hypothetical protein
MLSDHCGADQDMQTSPKGDGGWMPKGLSLLIYHDNQIVLRSSKAKRQSLWDGPYLATGPAARRL